MMAGEAQRAALSGNDFFIEFFRRFLPAVSADPVDHQFHFNHGVIGGQAGHRYTAFGKAKHLAARNTMEMRVLGRRFFTAGAKAPDPVIGRDPVGQSDLYQPFQITVEADAVNRPSSRRLQTLPQLGVTQWLLSFQQCLEDRYPQTGDALSDSAETLRCLGIGIFRREGAGG